MELSFTKVESILKTLPISYYVKRNLNVKLSDKEKTSYCDLMNDAIVISFTQLQNAIKDLKESNDLEADIRCLLYHETSHAYLTPKILTPTKLVNIFEDERIESVLRNYYKHVDFRSFVFRINNYHDEEPETALDMFYQVVRYRRGPRHFVARVSNLISQYKTLNRNSKSFDTPSVYEYAKDIAKLYEDIEAYFYTTPLNKLHEHLRRDHIKLSDLDADVSDLSHGQAEEQLKKLTSKINSTSQSEEQLNKEVLSNEGAAECLASISDTFYSQEVYNDINLILTSVKNSTKHNGSAINAYSGIFNPRSVIRSDYKYFVQQNRLGHVKAYSKIHLNLFIDSSGSFCSNDLTVNKLLYALTKFEKSNPQFSFDLISCGYYNVIRDRHDRLQHSSGGNKLTPDIFDIFKKMQLPQTHNINVVLFDGDAFSDFYDDEKRDNYKNFGAFNTSNTIVISDPSNQRHITKYCPLAKQIFTQCYCNELYKHVISSLQILCKN